MARRPRRQKAPAPKPPKPPAPAASPAAIDRAPQPQPPRRRAEPPPPEPRFWFGFAVPWAKLALVRFVLFGVLAVDAFLALRHAPRYGSGFNVGNLRVLDDLAPGRAAFTVIELALAYLFTLFAVGVALRLLPLAAFLYGWVYFSSQLDSYQHHYLVFLLLVIACAAPWRRPDGATPDTPVRSWALRLVLVQLGIMYAWAAIAKLHGSWLDGSALQQQIGTPWMVRMILHLPGGFATAARATLLLELFLAIAIWSRPLWWLAFPLGVAFHVNIELSGLQIGLFSYVMVALYLLALPDVIVVGAARWLAAAFGGAFDAALAGARRLVDGALLAPSLVIATATAVIAFARLPVAPAVSVVIVGAGAAIGTIVARLRGGPSAAARVVIAHVIVALLVATLDRATTVSYDYYKFWGGSARRLGHTDEERVAYEHLLAVDPTSVSAHYYLGGLDAAAGHDDEALAHWHAAESIDPRDARSFVAEARWLADKGRTAEALAAAKKAVAAEPNNRDAQQLVGALGGAGPNP